MTPHDGTIDSGVPGLAPRESSRAATAAGQATEAAPTRNTARGSRRRHRLALDLAAVRVLAWRDILRFFRQKSRVVGALAQPLIFWLVIGSGLSGSFRIQGAEGLGYQQYFFPGVVVLVVLFTSIFTTMSVIEDRHQGFLQAVLVAPASRAAIVLGKTLGGVTIALIQAAVFLLLAPVAGYSVAGVDWGLLALVLLLTAIGLSALGFALAWWLDSTQGYHVIMSVLLIPLWVLSGAMFPPGGATPWLATAMKWNPMAYCVAGVRRALDGGRLLDPVGIAGSTALREVAVVGLFAACAVAAAAWLIARPARRPRGNP